MASRGHSSNSGHGHTGGGYGGGHGGRPMGGHGGVGPRPHYHHGGSMSDFVLSAYVAKKLFDGDETYGSNEKPTAKKYHRVKNQVATKIVSGILYALTVVFIIMAIFSVDITYGKVTGTVESYDLIPRMGENYYFTSYHYVVKDKEYSAESQSGWSKLPESEETYIGSEYELYYKRTDPYIIYEIEDRANLPTAVVLYVFVAMFMLTFGLMCTKYGIWKTVENPQWQKQQEAIKEKNELGGKSRCKYCGTIANANDKKCPSCGASLN